MMSHIHCQDARKNPEYHLESRSVVDIIHVSLFLAELGIELRTFDSSSSPSHLTATTVLGRPTVQSPVAGKAVRGFGPVYQGAVEHGAVLGNARGAGTSPGPESCLLCVCTQFFMLTKNKQR